jgi:hypothetical protein
VISARDMPILHMPRLTPRTLCQGSNLSREAHPEVALLGTDADLIDDNGNFLGQSARLSTDVGLKWEMLSRNPFIHSSVMFPRWVVDKVGGYTTDPVIFRAFVEDYDLWSRVAQVPFAIVVEFLSY